MPNNNQKAETETMTKNTNDRSTGADVQPANAKSHSFLWTAAGITAILAVIGAVASGAMVVGKTNGKLEANDQIIELNSQIQKLTAELTVTKGNVDADEKLITQFKADIQSKDAAIAQMSQQLAASGKIIASTSNCTFIQAQITDAKVELNEIKHPWVSFAPKKSDNDHDVDEKVKVLEQRIAVFAKNLENCR